MWNLLRLEPDNIPNTLVAESVNTLVPSEDMEGNKRIFEGQKNVGEVLAKSFSQKAIFLRNKAIARPRTCPIENVRKTVNLGLLQAPLKVLKPLSQDSVREFLQRKLSRAKDPHNSTSYHLKKLVSALARPISELSSIIHTCLDFHFRP